MVIYKTEINEEKHGDGKMTFYEDSFSIITKCKKKDFFNLEKDQVQNNIQFVTFL